MNTLPRNLGRLHVPEAIINLRHVGEGGLEQGLNSLYWAELGAALAFSEVSGGRPVRTIWVDKLGNNMTISVDVEPASGQAVAIALPTGNAFMKSARRWSQRFLKVMKGR